MNKIVKTCPNSAEFLPLVQDILDLLNQKVVAHAQKVVFENIIQEHSN
jgi:hypothetical protein